MVEQQQYTGALIYCNIDNYSTILNILLAVAIHRNNNLKAHPRKHHLIIVYLLSVNIGDIVIVLMTVTTSFIQSSL